MYDGVCTLYIYGTGRGRYATLTYSMISEAVKLLHHNLFENVHVSDQNVGLLTDIKSELHIQIIVTSLA